MALLDYLRSHGNDPEKIQMVSLKFGMFRELAKTKEDQAMAEVKSIKPKQLGQFVYIWNSCIVSIISDKEGIHGLKMHFCTGT